MELLRAYQAVSGQPHWEPDFEVKRIEWLKQETRPAFNNVKTKDWDFFPWLGSVQDRINICKSPDRGLDVQDTRLYCIFAKH